MLGGIERDFARNGCWIITQLCDHFAQILVMYSRRCCNGAFVFGVLHAETGQEFWAGLDWYVVFNAKCMAQAFCCDTSLFYGHLSYWGPCNTGK